MDVKFEKLDAIRAEITVTLKEEDYAAEVTKQLKEIGRRRPEPGFRAGNVPEGILRKKYGNAVKYDVVSNKVGTAVYDYLRENKVHALGQPMPIAEGTSDLEDADMTYVFKVGIAPEIDLNVNSDIHVPYYQIKVSDEMIDERDRLLRRRFGKQEPGEVTDPTAVIKGVLTELNEDGSVKEDGIVVENGIVAPQYFRQAEQAKLFEEKHPGDVVRFNPAATCDANVTEMSSMLNIDKADVNNHLGDFNMEIKEIIVVVPAELNQEYFDMVFGKDQVHNEEEYRNALKEQMEAELKGNSDYKFTLDVRHVLTDKVGEVELPDDILIYYLEHKDGNPVSSGAEVAQEYEAMKPSLIWQLITDKVIDQLGVKVEEEDVKNMAKVRVREQMAQYGMMNAPESLVEQYSENVLKDDKARERLVMEAESNKMYDALFKTVTIDRNEVTPEEFGKLFKD
ncbi:MAG: hypothetical protein J1E97_01740 [Muribaculaceae bacterium]|nr:hypothetical protein [Muribaculaceae bacterium]